MSAPLAHPLCIVGDVHLGRGTRREVGAALGRLVRACPEHEIVLNGDSFDLSMDPPHLRPEDSIAEILAEHAEACDALRGHGAPVLFIAGNHDAALARAECRARMAEVLPNARIAAWLARRGPIHIEHGHLYDPDNAPNHPLADWSSRTEPLGVALTRHFLAPARAFELAHASETTPWSGLVRAFSIYGVRAPKVVLDYFATAFRLTARAGASAAAEERLTGARAIAALSAETGVDADALRAMALLAGSPTHHSKTRMFFRLYLDRSIATLALAGAVGALATGARAPIGLAAVSAGYLGFSLARGVNRYRGVLEARLLDAAERVRELSGASCVVFGHSHRSHEGRDYVNPGSFAYPDREGRGWVEVDRQGGVELRTSSD